MFKTEEEDIKSNLELLSRIPENQKKEVFSSMCDIDATFLGFVDTYKVLAELIPEHYTVIDLGCAYNPQCFYFLNHKQYVAIDIWQGPIFKSPNCIIYRKSIAQFITENLHEFNLDETFAICNYVPPWHNDNGKLVRNAFKNVYVFYPAVQII